MSFTLHADGGVTLTNPRGSLDLSKDQCAIIYEIGKYASETKKTRCGIDWVNEAESVEAEQRKMLEVARAQGYDPVREVALLKGQLAAAKKEAVELHAQIHNLRAAFAREQQDHEDTRDALKKEQDAHTALKYQVADLQKISQSFNELKKAVTGFWNR